ncbi:hypothetical protein NPIL_664621 [Nephila pilipes]|uniref:Uncharacterized protein n=1 Tax=Nephila pilipes TaxID=299642 RepID=A0A8X6TYC2_NEPPI|nr:hypothetical protein NPIL_664621 [Nephila pilipes]
MKNPNFLEIIRNIPLHDRDEDKVSAKNDTDKEHISVGENDLQSEWMQLAIPKIEIMMIDLQMQKSPPSGKRKYKWLKQNGRKIYSRKQNNPLAIYVSCINQASHRFRKYLGYT